MRKLPTGAPITGEKNNPLALRMGVIAFLNQTITAGTSWGSFSVLLAANEARLHVNRELSTLGIPALLLASACLAPVAGMLAAKYPLRLVALVGALFSFAGFLLLAFSSSFPLYLAAFGLLLGPGFAVGIIMPSTLVARWFQVHRGRALGFVNIPILFAILPLVTTWVLHAYGVRVAYLMLAALTFVNVVASLFVQNPPEASKVPLALGIAEGPAHTQASILSLAGLLRSPRFWAIAIGANASVMGSVILTTHMVPMARSWGIAPTAAATLLSVLSLVAIVGTVFFGWISDRLGGPLTLAVLVLDSAILWALLLLHPPFAALIVIMGLIGFHAVGAGPAMGMSLSQIFGTKTFSRAYGMANLVALPFTVIAVPAASVIFARTGSYFGVIIGEILFLAVMLPLVLTVLRKPHLAVTL